MTQSRNKEPSTRSTKNNLPLILSMGVSRVSTTVRVHCELPDAEYYAQYILYTYKAQPVQGQLSLQEIEERFNALAWASIWKKDIGFKKWLKRQKEPLQEGVPE